MTGDSPTELAERHLVGALLHLSAPEQGEALAVIDEAQVHSRLLVRILEAIRQLHTEQGRAEPAAIVPRLLAFGMPESHCGSATSLVVDLLADVPDPRMWPYYWRLIGEEHARRTVRHLADRLAAAADDADLDYLSDLLDDGRERLAEHMNQTENHEH